MQSRVTATTGVWRKAFCAGVAVVLVACALSTPALAGIVIRIDKPTQTMTVSVDGQTRYRWPVSTGATGYSTPTGSYTAFRMVPMHYSREWDGAGMPHSIFFTTRGHAIHGSNHPGMGTPRSHGCVRLSLSHAETLFRLVEQRGMGTTKVVVKGADPAGHWAASEAPTQTQSRTRSRTFAPFRGLFAPFGGR